MGWFCFMIMLIHISQKSYRRNYPQWSETLQYLPYSADYSLWFLCLWSRKKVFERWTVPVEQRSAAGSFRLFQAAERGILPKKRLLVHWICFTKKYIKLCCVVGCFPKCWRQFCMTGISILDCTAFEQKLFYPFYCKLIFFMCAILEIQIKKNVWIQT